MYKLEDDIMQFENSLCFDSSTITTKQKKSINKNKIEKNITFSRTKNDDIVVRENDTNGN